MPEARLQRTRDLYERNPARVALRAMANISIDYDRAFVRSICLHPHIANGMCQACGLAEAIIIRARTAGNR